MDRSKNNPSRTRVPFGSSQERKLNENMGTSNYTPGPGNYLNDTVSNSGLPRELNQKGFYYINDNGHINLRP